MTGSPPQHIVVNTYDLETFTRNDLVVPVCCCFILDDNEYVFYDEKCIIDSISAIADASRSEYIEFFIHNINFDGVLLIDELSRNCIQFYIFSNKTNIYYIDFFYFNKKIRFRCSYKLIPLSLNTIAEVGGMTKKYFPYRFLNASTKNYIGPIPDCMYWEKDDFSRYCSLNSFDKEYCLKSELIEYCLNDVWVLKKSLESIVYILNSEKKKIVEKCFSTPSLSYDIFFYKFNQKNIKKFINMDEDVFFRKSYFGGRCEVFANPYQGEIIKYFDFSGMYGQCMSTLFHSGKGKFVLNSDYRKVGFHKIFFKSSNMYLPVLPRHNENNKLMFANGCGVGVYWFEEIIKFVEMGGVVEKVCESLIYDRFEKVFDTFVEHFTRLREKGGYYKTFSKLIVNSLYGGMGLRSEREFTHVTFSDKEFQDLLDRVNVTSFYRINKAHIIVIKDDYKYRKIFKKKRDSLNDKSLRNVSYAAAITSKARVKLYTALINASNEGSRVLYCDTDSIFASHDPTYFSKTKSDINWLEYYSDGVFIAPKTYAVYSEKESLVRIKGVKVRDKNFDQIKMSFYDDRLDFINFEEQMNVKRSNFVLKQTIGSKKIALKNYDKRIFVNNKKDTIPYEINDVISNPDI